jgi:hypothetical protein
VFSFRTEDDGERRRVTLDASGHRFNAFFDRLTIAPLGLELNRLHFANQVIDIPPWLLTLGPEPDVVDDVLPSTLDGRFGTIHSPYRGVTTSKVVGAGCWTIGLLISGAGGHVLSTTLRFGAGGGLCRYDGQFFGDFLSYERQDEPGCQGCS